MRKINADVWILTETSQDAVPGDDFELAASVPIRKSRVHSAGENRTSVWSRFPLRELVTYDPETAVCVQVTLPRRALLVYGTVLPYGAAGTRYAYRSDGKFASNRESWALQYQAIQKHESEWRRLRRKYPDHFFCVGGDFNQSRDGRIWNGRQWYGTKLGRDMLSDALQAAGLVCVTEEDFVATGKLKTKSSVDHICLDSRLADQVKFVGAWEAGCLKDGTRLTDHNGVYVDVEL